MPLDEAQVAAAKLILDACADECAGSPLGNLLEGHLKVVAANALLLAGYSILEGANAKGQGRLVCLREGHLRAVLDARPAMPAYPDSARVRMSPDLRVWEPCRLVVELQVRTCVGSQSALFSENLLDDMRRVGTKAVDLFVLVADRPLYDALRGIKGDRRGRKAKYAEVLPLLLPPSETMASRAKPEPWAAATMVEHVVAAGVLLKTPFNVERCVVGVWAG